ncbi:MAG TPA: protease complex subunit PrcB family protein [Acidobacteriota bacterium]
MKFSFYCVLVLFFNFALALGLHADEKKSKDEEEQTQTMPTISYEVLLEGTFSGIKEPLQKVITTNQEWEDLWKKHVSVIVPQPPVPEVDFENYVVAAIYQGEKNKGGYQVLLKQVEPQGKDIIVHYKLVEPPENSFTLSVLTQPFILVKLPKPEGTVQLTQQQVTETKKK